MNRRDFLRNAAIIAGGAIAADQLELLERLAPRRLYFAGWNYTLWGDGEHDDTAAIQAVVDGKRVINQRDGREVRHGILDGGDYRITSTIVIPSPHVLTLSSIRFTNCRITGRMQREEPLFHMEEAANLELHSCWLRDDRFSVPRAPMLTSKVSLG